MSGYNQGTMPSRSSTQRGKRTMTASPQQQHHHQNHSSPKKPRTGWVRHERKIEPKGKSKFQSDQDYPIPDGALLIGDSMLRAVLSGIDCIPLNDLFIFSYPGITAGGLVTEMKSEYLPPPCRIGTVILHVGTNNASRRREDSTPEEAANEIIDCIDMVRELYTVARIWVSGILPRLDDDHDRGQAINHIVAVHCNTVLDRGIKFLDFGKEFGSVDSFRNSEESDDFVHLSEDGGKIFLKLLTQTLELSAFYQKGRQVKGSSLMDVEEWNAFRIKTFGMFGEHNRFRVTNFMPAREKSYSVGSRSKTKNQKKEKFQETSESSQHSPNDDLPVADSQDTVSVCSHFSAEKFTLDEVHEFDDTITDHPLDVIDEDIDCQEAIESNGSFTENDILKFPEYNLGNSKTDTQKCKLHISIEASSHTLNDPFFILDEYNADNSPKSSTTELKLPSPKNDSLLTVTVNTQNVPDVPLSTMPSRRKKK